MFIFASWIGSSQGRTHWTIFFCSSNVYNVFIVIIIISIKQTTPMSQTHSSNVNTQACPASSHVCMPTYMFCSQRLCVAYVPHSVGRAYSLPGANKLTLSAPVLHSSPLGESHSHQTHSYSSRLQGMLCVWVIAQTAACHLLAAICTAYSQDMKELILKHVKCTVTLSDSVKKW